MRRISRLLLPAVLFSLVFSGLQPAFAAPPDSWIKWNLPDTWIRSLDYVTPTQLVAASNNDGVYTATSAAGPWTDITGNLPTLGKQVRQAAGKAGQIYLATSLALYRGTGNGSWTKLGVDDSTPQDQRLDQGGVQSVYFPGGDATEIVVATAGAGDDGVFYSSDSGKRWTKATGLTTATFYLTGVGSLMFAAAPTGVYRSTNGGKSWTLTSDGIPPSESTLRVAIVDANLFAATTGGVYRSDNGGTTWYDANGSGAGLLNGGTVRAFQVVPFSYWTDGEPKMIVGASNGVWATVDGGQSWTKMSSAKLNDPGGIPMGNEAVWSLNLGFGTPGSLMAGTQGHGIFTLPLSAVEAPASISSPSGSPVQGYTLTANNGIWAGTGPFLYRYQWKRCDNASAASCSSIAGATDRTYQIVQADVGKYLRVGVRAINLVQPVFSAEVLSAAVGPVAAPAGFEPTPPTNYPKLVDGTSAPWGVTMTIDPSDDATERWRSNGIYTTTTFEYFWNRCTLNLSTCDAIPGATGISYTTTVEDVDHLVEARVVGTIGGTKSPSRLAGVSGAVYERKPVNVSAPRIVGKPYIGAVLQSTAGVWTGTNPTYTRRWFRCNGEGLQCALLNPAVTASSYKVKSTDKGFTFKLEVTARVEDQFQPRTQTALSAKTAKVTPPPPTCAQLRTAVKKAKAGVVAAQKALKKAKATGNAAKIKAAKKKLAAAQAKLKKAKATLAKRQDC